MKLLHIADTQLGAQFKTLGEKAPLQREQIKKTFHKTLEAGAKEGIGLVLIAGDLFDSNHPSHDLTEFVRGEIKYLKDNNISLCIVPGHHDCLDEHGIYNRERFDDEFSNVFIFRNPEGEMKEYSDLDLAIFAKPNISNQSAKSPLPDLAKLPSSMQYKVVAAHGDLQIPGKSAENYHPISIGELEALPPDISYVALGHWHSMRDCSQYGKFQMPVWYSGSPELVAVDQQGSGNVLLVDFDKETKIKSILVGARSSSSLSLDISTFQDLGELKGKILERADKNLILSVELTGLNTNTIMMSAENLEEELEDQFFYVRIKDASHLALKEIPEYPDALVQGQFLKIMRKKIKEASDADKKIYEEALQVGLMELDGKEVV